MAITAYDNADDFKNALAENPATVVKFWAPWCGPCKMMKPAYKEASEQLGEHAAFGEVDIDQNPEIAQSLGIRSIPTIVVFKNGEAADNIVGNLSKSQLLERLQASI